MKTAVIIAIFVCGVVYGVVQFGWYRTIRERDAARTEVERLQYALNESNRDYAACDAGKEKLRALAADSLTELFRDEPILEECGRRYSLHPDKGGDRYKMKIPARRMGSQ